MSEFDDLVQKINSCTSCTLAATRNRAVPGEGSPTADIMFIGEGPGFYEDRDGRPFVGPAGKFLDQLLASIGLSREDVFITNMVKCRPPNNRDPLPEELSACRTHLDKQLEMISPKVVVTLGRHSFSKFFPGEAISKARGRSRSWNGRTVFPMYHPAAGLHNPKLRPVIESDFNQLPALILSVARTPDVEPQEVAPAQQLNMFE